MARARKRRFFAKIVFTAYTLTLLYWMFFAFSRTQSENFKYNITPFSTIKNYFTYYDHFPIDIWLINIAGNIGVFIPFGILLPMLFPKLRNIFLFTFTFVVCISIVEGLQLLSKLGSFDVDDILLNTVGAIIGLFFMKTKKVR
ncbi:VanZ family protein [Fredinandcohnia humi]